MRWDLFWVPIKNTIVKFSLSPFLFFFQSFPLFRFPSLPVLPFSAIHHPSSTLVLCVLWVIRHPVHTHTHTHTHGLADLDDTIQEINAGAELVDRRHLQWSRYAYTSMSDNLAIERHGVIKQWRYFSRRPGWSFFQVWRPDPAGGDFMWVGSRGKGGREDGEDWWLRGWGSVVHDVGGV